MEFQNLTSAQALSLGADLWYLPHPTQSFWSRRIDWLNNFAFLKSMTHRQASKPERLQQILEQTGLPRFQNPLLVPVTLLAPNLNIEANALLFEQSENHFNEQQSEILHRIWRDLKHPKLRVFLPNDKKPLFTTGPWSSELGAIQWVSE